MNENLILTINVIRMKKEQLTENKAFCQTAVMRSFYLRNTNFIISSICILGLFYVNLGLPFRVKRIDYGSTFLEAMY